MLVGVEAPQLACAAFEIIAPENAGGDALRVRAGMAVGEVLMFEGDDYIGRTVNLAARLCDLAGPGELLAPTPVAAVLPESLGMRPHALLAIAGFRVPVEVGSVQLTAAAGAMREA